MNGDTGRQIESLSRDLGLNNEPQDWGIINADPNRVEEFLDFARQTQLTTAQQYAMVELVLASVNEALIQQSLPTSLHAPFDRFLGSGVHGLDDQIRYWKGLKSEEEFPIAVLLKTRPCTVRPASQLG